MGKKAIPLLNCLYGGRMTEFLPITQYLPVRTLGDYDSDDEKSQVEKLRHAKVPRGMFVSGWDDDADELIEEDKNPQSK